MMTPLEQEVQELSQNVAVLSTTVSLGLESVNSTLSDIKVDIGKRSDDKTVQLWFKEHILNCIDRKEVRESSAPAVHGVWLSLSEKQRTTIIGAVVGLISTVTAIAAMKLGG